MKKLLIVLSWGFSLSTLLLACGGGDGAATKDEKKGDTVASNNTNSLPSFITQAEYDKAVEFIAGSDCLGCHTITQKTNGPAYKEIAQKYDPTEANIDTLASKIINGGSGNWGPVPMAPHPNISKEDARTLAKYVLSLRNAE